MGRQVINDVPVSHISSSLAMGANSVQIMTASVTLTEHDNGSIIVLGAAAPGTITLPAVADSKGYRIKVITGFALTSNAVVASAEGDNIEGSMIVAGAVVDVNAADQINFVNTADNIGDFVELVCDGTYWHAFGNALTTGALTATG